MGQAFRRASGRIRATTSNFATPLSSRQPSKRPADGTPPVTSTGFTVDSEGTSGVNRDNVLEERDPQYDAMLSQMVGRIRSKPGGISEMGEAFVVEKHNRPMPKLRNTRPDSARYEERPVPPGMLNVAQLRHIVLLYQGKADDHNGPMNVRQIAEKFRVNVAQVEKILKFVSLPPEDSNKDKGPK